MRYGRNYVPAGGEMYRAVARNAEGEEVRAFGPYSTVAPAKAARHGLARKGLTVTVEVCHPEWQPIEGTEL